MQEEDTLDQVLRACRFPNEALKSSPNVLHDALSCSICNGLMLEPYTLHCGHTFCRACLGRWIKECHASSTCPQCREPIIAEPALSLVIRELALAAVASWNVDHPDRVVPEDALRLEEKPQFFQPGMLDAPQYDSDDGVYRCPVCNFEIEEDGFCAGCGREFNRNRMNFDADYTQDDSDSDDDHYGHDLVDDEAIDVDDDDDEEYGRYDGPRTNRGRTSHIINLDSDEDEDWDRDFDPQLDNMSDLMRLRERFEEARDSNGRISMDPDTAVEGVRNPQTRARLKEYWTRWLQYHRDGLPDASVTHPRPVRRPTQISDDDDSSLDSFIDDDDNAQDNSMDTDSDLDSSRRPESPSEVSDSDASQSGSAADTSDDSLLEELNHRDVGRDDSEDDVQITSVRHRKTVVDDE